MTDTMQGVLPWSAAGQTTRLFRHARRPNDHGVRSASPPGPRCWGFSVELLSQYRVDAGMTYRALARASGLPTATVSSIERGVQQPNPAQVRALADALGIDDWALTWA